MQYLTGVKHAEIAPRAREIEEVAENGGYRRIAGASLCKPEKYSKSLNIACKRHDP